MDTVVVVPGFGGSELYSIPVLFGQRIHVWLAIPELLAGSWRLMGLGPDGHTPSIRGLPELLPGEPLIYFYGPLNFILQRAGWNVLSPTLDWRGTIDRDADRLVNFLLGNGDLHPLHIIAHSRGGLVVRRALQKLNSLGLLGIIGRVAGLGVPHSGSLGTVAMVAGWYYLVQSLRAVLEGSQGLLINGLPLANLLDVCRTWPGSYELFVKPGATSIPQDTVEQIYSLDAWASAGINLPANRLSDARSWWASFGPSPAEVPWLDVAGTGIGTPVGIPDFTRLAYADSMVYNLDGDGVVLRPWALASGHPSITVSLDHQAITQAPDLIRHVGSWLKTGQL